MIFAICKDNNYKKEKKLKKKKKNEILECSFFLFFWMKALSAFFSLSL